MHEDVALEFARWLSPAFAVWCNDRIKELLRTGVSTINNDDEAILHAMQVLQKRVEENKVHIELLESQTRKQEESLQIAAPKVNYYDRVMQSANTMTTTQVGQHVGMNAQELNRKLAKAGIIYRQSSQWILRSPYSGWKLHSVRTQTYTRSDGSVGTSTYLVWTNLGCRFISALKDNDFNIRKAVAQVQGETTNA